MLTDGYKVGKVYRMSLWLIEKAIFQIPLRCPQYQNLQYVTYMAKDT